MIFFCNFAQNLVYYLNLKNNEESSCGYSFTQPGSGLDLCRRSDRDKGYRTVSGTPVSIYGSSNGEG